MFEKMNMPHLKFNAISLIAVLCIAWLSPVKALEDPTRPPTTDIKKMTSVNTTSKKSRWVLSSTLISSSRRTAVINDKVVSKGDRVNGATVVSIEPSAVRLRNRGRVVILTLLKKNIKSLSRVVMSGQRKRL